MTDDGSYIVVNHNSKQRIFLLKDGKLELETLQRYFPGAAGLSAEINEKILMIGVVDGKLEVPNVKQCNVEFPESCVQKHDKLTGNKKLQYDEIMEQYKSGNETAKKKQLKKKQTAIKVGTAKKSKMEVKTIQFTWKNQKFLHNSAVLVSEPFGGKKHVTLKTAIQYTFDDIKQTAIKAYRNKSSKHIFDNCTIEIALHGCKVVDNFYDSDGDICDLWECNEAKDGGDRIHIYLITRELRDLTKSLIETAGAFNSSHSLLVDKNVEKLDSEKEQDQKHSTISGSKPLEDSVKTPKKASKSFNTEDYPRIDIQAAIDKLPLNSGSEVTDSSLIQLSQKQSPKRKSDTRLEIPIRKPLADASNTSNKQQGHLSYHTEEYEKMYKQADIDKMKFKEPKVPSLQNVESYKIPIVSMIPPEELKFSNIELGRGSFGVVSKGFYLKTPVAIKSLDLIGEDKTIIREISILAQVNHENVISIMAASRGKMQFHIIMPFYESISLKDALFNDRYKNDYILNEELKNLIALQVCRGIYYLHSNPRQVIHRDIKPANILVDKQYKVKVCDLGLSKINLMATELLTTNRAIKSTPGTPMYMAPELYLHDEEATVHSDVWSLACTLVELYSQNIVWQLDYCKKITLQSKLSTKEIPDLSAVAGNLKATIKECFNYIATKRPGADAIIELTE